MKSLFQLFHHWHISMTYLLINSDLPLLRKVMNTTYWSLFKFWLTLRLKISRKYIIHGIFLPKMNMETQNYWVQVNVKWLLLWKFLISKCSRLLHWFPISNPIWLEWNNILQEQLIQDSCASLFWSLLPLIANNVEGLYLLTRPGFHHTWQSPRHTISLLHVQSKWNVHYWCALLD